MQIVKCDICKKIIKTGKISLSISNTPKILFQRYEFCDKCATPLKNFLEKNKLFETTQLRLARKD